LCSFMAFSDLFNTTVTSTLLSHSLWRFGASTPRIFTPPPPAMTRSRRNRTPCRARPGERSGVRACLQGADCKESGVARDLVEWRLMIKKLKQAVLGCLKTLGVFTLAQSSRWRRNRLLILAYHGLSLEDEHLWNPDLFMSPDCFRGRIGLLKKRGC